MVSCDPAGDDVISHAKGHIGGTAEIVGPSKPRLLGLLGPGLITGASDDDPSGIATYSQAGAQIGLPICWVMLFTYPLMAVTQEISARVGRTTGRGLAGNIARHYPAWLVQSCMLLLLIANIANLGADLGAMGAAVTLLIGGPALLYVALFGLACVLAQIYLSYARYVAILKWSTLALFAYFGVLLSVHVPWGEVPRDLAIPSLQADKAYITTLVAVLGTTISPYLFFWQSSQEAEDQRTTPEREKLLKAPEQAEDAHRRIKLDTYVGMALSNLVGLAIIITTAATLHAHGVTNIESSTQAAEALRPLAGRFAFFIFALGIIGTGLLAVPVLAGSAAYAIGEARRWPVGLTREPRRAKLFYATLAVATGLGVAFNVAHIDPISALFWSAVINGVVAVPVMALMMHMASDEKIMRQFAVRGPLRIIGWVATIAMAASILAMAATSLS